MKAPRGKYATRTPIALACTECGSRNYKTTKAKTAQGQLSLKKFCRVCGKHTAHIDSK